ALPEGLCDGRVEDLVVERGAHALDNLLIEGAIRLRHPAGALEALGLALRSMSFVPVRGRCGRGTPEASPGDDFGEPNGVAFGAGLGHPGRPILEAVVLGEHIEAAD